MNTAPSNAGVSVRQRTQTSKRSWKAIVGQSLRDSFAKDAESAFRGTRFAGLTNLTHTEDWFDSVSTPIVATYSGKSFFQNGVTMPIELRDYQIDAVERFRDVGNVGVWDEMGTGKTVIAIAIDAVRRSASSKGKTLVICPKGVKVSDWARHFQMMNPDLKVIKLDPKARGVSWREFEGTDADVLIVHWHAVQIMMQDYLSTITWLHIIADEVHAIKNRNTKTAKALKKIPAIYKTGLSGTPADDKPQDYWSILNWLYPKGPDWVSDDDKPYFRSYWKFVGHFVTTSKESWQQYTTFGDPKNVEHLHRLTAPFTIRRLKKDVLPELGDKNPIPYWIEMTPKQAKAYEQMKKDMVAWVDEMEAQGEMTPIIANAAIARLVRLQQFACAYATVDDENQVQLTEPSSKLDAAWDIMMERLDEDMPVVLYSSFKQLIYLLKARLEKAGIPYSEVTGDVKDQARIDAVDNFQSGKTNVFLGTVRAGGEGIDLYRSKTLIFLARDWNPAKNAQVEDRLHRLGQQGIVDVIDIYVQDTVEVDKKETVELKWERIRTLLGDT